MRLICPKTPQIQFFFFNCDYTMSYQNPPNTVKPSPCPVPSVNDVRPTSTCSKSKGLIASFQSSNSSSNPHPPVMTSSPPCHSYRSHNNSGAPNHFATHPLIGNTLTSPSVQNPPALQSQVSSYKSTAGFGLNLSSSTFGDRNFGSPSSSGTYGLVSNHSAAWPTPPPGVSSVPFGPVPISRLSGACPWEPLSPSTTNVPGSLIPSLVNITASESRPAQQGFAPFVGKFANNLPMVPSPNVSLPSSIEKSQKDQGGPLHTVNEPTTTVPRPNSSSSPARENSRELGHQYDGGESDIASIEDTEDTEEEDISHGDHIVAAELPMFTLTNENGSKRNYDPTTNRTKYYGHDTETSADETDKPPSSKRQKPLRPQNPHCEYHCPANSNPDSDLPIVHAVITNRRHRRNGPTRYRLEKLFSDKEEAAKYAAEWVWEKYSKFEDSAKQADLDVLGRNDGIGFYTPASWNEAKGMDFRACVQRRYLE
jgi:hypothetical protein